jgi:hypothetical protein
MNKNIEHYFYHKMNFLDEKFCKNSIDELNKCGWEKHNWYDYKTDSLNSPSGDNEPEIIVTDNFSTDVGEINSLILNNLHSTLSEYVESFKFDWFPGWDGYTAMKFIRYFPGQKMKNHCDHIHSIFDGERKGVPILTIIGVLNDDYEGGELIMFEDKKIDTKAGDILIFPSNFLYPHEITPVLKGVRYSYISWVW